MNYDKRGCTAWNTLLRASVRSGRRIVRQHFLWLCQLIETGAGAGIDLIQVADGGLNQACPELRWNYRV